ncbi:MAG TPA: hypothetical protein VJ549_05435 [Geothrix sp.]|nr:hypothetical protein [Geothrix sp.]
MAAHTHHEIHPILPLERFALGHPYAGKWAILTAAALAGLLLWYWNS